MPVGSVSVGSVSEGSGDATGVDLARAALAAAKERARERGLAGRQPRGRRRAERTGRDDGQGGDPRPFGATIRELVAERGWERTERAAAVVGRWEAIVGADVAAHCRPESLQDGRLVVVAESTAWATQLRLLQHSLLERIGADVGPGVVTSLHVHGPTVPDWRKGPRRVTGRGPRDTYG